MLIIFSIVHSEEEVAGSYNWDYLLDWGPQYQPLAHVFHEISALKDESGTSESRVPPIITCRPPRHVHAPLQSNVSHARSPLSHEMMSQSAMSPSFSPALSPLATRSPSISPLGVAGPPAGPTRGTRDVTRGITAITVIWRRVTQSCEFKFQEYQNIVIQISKIDDESQDHTNKLFFRPVTISLSSFLHAGVS